MDRIIGFGASSMQGVGDPDGGFFKRVERKLSRSVKPVRCVNLGIGGNTTRDMLRRASALKAPYDLVVLLGCNDMPRRNDQWPEARARLPEYTRNVETLLSRIRGYSSLFISSFRPSLKLTGVQPDTFDAYMSTAMGIAQKHGYEIWDLYRESRPRLRRCWAPDGMHFNALGHQYIATNVLSWIAQRRLVSHDMSRAAGPQRRKQKGPPQMATPS